MNSFAATSNLISNKILQLVNDTTIIDYTERISCFECFKNVHWMDSVWNTLKSREHENMTSIHILIASESNLDANSEIISCLNCSGMFRCLLCRWMPLSTALTSISFLISVIPVKSLVYRLLYKGLNVNKS